MSALVRSRWFFSAFAFLVATSCAAQAYAAQFPAGDVQAACAHTHRVSLTFVDGIEFAAYHDDQTGLACFQVLAAGKVIFRRTNNNGYFFLGQHSSRDPNIGWNVPNIPNGTDITGLGNPDMVVYHYTGGAHCCLLAWVFELKPALRLLATIDAEDSWPAYFYDHNGHFYFKGDDWTFAYWPSSFAGSPVAQIVLQFVPDGKGGGSYHLALDEMHRPPPSEAELNKQLQRAHNSFNEGTWPFDIGATLWTSVMRLIYSGQSELAWKFLNAAWPAKVPGKENWVGDFCSQLKASPYWLDLKPTLRGTPAACARKLR